MSNENTPSPEELERLRARQKSSVLFACTLLVIVAVALLVLPLEDKIPRAARIFMAALDLVIAAVLWLVARQKFSGK